MPSSKNLCIHTHFYQPSREDPFSGIIPDEPGASPYRNWNEKIFEDCYRPNVEVGNFNKISFNIGPTLSQWMKNTHPDTFNQIVNADKKNVEKYGVGNAIAQSYHHSILPLASSRDKQTQISWGIYDFQRTFGRKPQGMWLPETAVDTECLELLAQNGIQFTILAPWQAESDEIDPKKIYQVALRDGKSIKIIFYHSGISSRISFDPNSTLNADLFNQNYISSEFSSSRESEMLLVASDGELYGHHQSFRDKFLEHLLNGSLRDQGISDTYPALYFQDQTEIFSITIKENTSWSCHHGIERWRGSCACTINNAWKKPLRDALDELSQDIDKIFYDFCSPELIDPWAVRDDYIRVWLGDCGYSEWFEQKVKGNNSDLMKVNTQKLLQTQVERQRMFTSCGWFFDDFDRIEPRNNVIYAAHAVWLTKQATEIDLSIKFAPALEKVKSWMSGLNAREVFLDAIERFEKQT